MKSLFSMNLIKKLKENVILLYLWHNYESLFNFTYSICRRQQPSQEGGRRSETWEENVERTEDNEIGREIVMQMRDQTRCRDNGVLALIQQYARKKAFGR